VGFVRSADVDAEFADTLETRYASGTRCFAECLKTEHDDGIWVLARVLQKGCDAVFDRLSVPVVAPSQPPFGVPRMLHFHAKKMRDIYGEARTPKDLIELHHFVVPFFRRARGKDALEPSPAHPAAAAAGGFKVLSEEGRAGGSHERLEHGLSGRLRRRRPHPCPCAVDRRWARA
jgi:hypothetical protein